jgi:biopolymer transport protein ExbD
MAMSTGAKGGFTSEPNLTPMIDVLLVLLIIFMVIVPTARKALDVQLPDPSPAPSTPTPNTDQIVLEVQKDGTYLINKQPVPAGPQGLAQMIHTTFDNRPDKLMFVKGDPAAKYQQVIQAMDVARGSGVLVIGITPKATQ